MSLSQKAYDRIKRKIIYLELEPGAVIDELALQKELDLGRTPIREALKRLEVEQLVTIIPRRGMFVSEISITDLYQIFELRVGLEALAVRLAVQRGNEAHWQRMDEVLNSEPWDSLTEIDLIEIDEACHLIIYEAAENRFLQQTLQTYYSLSLRLWYFFLAKIGDMQAAVREHQQIYEAIRSGQSEEAARLMVAHLQAFQTEMYAHMSGK
ncbi:MAG: GntR family transcriptional regulator [Chloroflexi bacterium]|nr:GntR family transcriptional regulator [Chloroflexota bacterium]